MAIITKISNAAAIAAVDAITGLLNIGGAGRIDIFDGTMPADVDTAITTQNKLASLLLSNPAFQAADDQVGYARAVSWSINNDSSANATGTATWFRAYNGAGDAVIDGNVGTTDSSLVLSKVDIVINEIVSISPWHLQLYET